MALDAPLGFVSEAEVALGTMLSKCEAFQSFVGAADDTEALARIYYGAIDRPAASTFTTAERASLYPYCLIETVEGGTAYKAVGASQCYGTSGSLRFMLCKFDDPLLTHAENSRRHKNHWGQIIEQLWGQSMVGGTIELSSIDASGAEETEGMMGLAELGVEDATDEEVWGDLFVRAFDVVWNNG